ncbi:hypothetical protein D3C71_1266260 [compost metagenome]
MGSMPSTPVIVVPKPKVVPSRSSSGVTEVTAVRRFSAASRMAANASTRPRSRDEAWGSGDVMGVDLVQVAQHRGADVRKRRRRRRAGGSVDSMARMGQGARIPKAGIVPAVHEWNRQAACCV